MSSCSIIIPVFNHLGLMRQCVDAVLSTVDPDIEIIVVDDGSAELMPVLHERVRVIRHSANAGFATSCNDGAHAASGSLLIFLNDDTIPHAGWLHALVDFSTRHPKAAGIG